MEFFAVTTTSVYRVSDEKDEDGIPIVEKIALKGQSKILVGGRLKNGYLVGISRDRICLYQDEEMSPYASINKEHPRPLEEVNTFFWGGTTSPIIALFFKKDEALKCLNSPDLKYCDPRWKEQTKEVLATIGNNHPVFILSKKEYAISYIKSP